MTLGSGTVTLAGGTATVPLGRIPATAVVLLSPKSLLGTIGALGWSITPGASFTITSLSALDVSVVGWVVIV